jgi:YfiH family protein
VDSKDGGTMLQDADGLITTKPNLALSVTGADCFPVYYFDPEHNAIGLAHAGWRGLVRGIQRATVEKMHETFGTSPSDLRIGIGPGLCKNHFVVQNDVLEQFAPYTEHVTRADATHWHVDLVGMLRETLRAAGVADDYIEESGVCTYEHPEKYFSYRRDKIQPVQAGMAVMMLRPEDAAY